MHHMSNHHGSTVRHLIQENSVKIARLTEGFFPQDLKRLSTKIAASSTDLDAPELLSFIANAETLAMSDSTLKPMQNARIYFSDIGGLEKVKQALIESVIWPGKVNQSSGRYINKNSHPSHNQSLSNVRPTEA